MKKQCSKCEGFGNDGWCDINMTTKEYDDVCDRFYPVCHVKQLEWTYNRITDVFSSVNILAQYSFNEHEKLVRYLTRGKGGYLGRYDNIDEAKEAAQEHFEELCFIIYTWHVFK